ncbi:hypothetical protein ADU37_CDS16750 [Thermococcus sp. 2319x1]|nr:hypothetical protein ADU37_CDS16750 [Thermococcus sp. 2319x1]
MPGFEKVSEREHRLWDLASQLAYITPAEDGASGGTIVL